MKKTSRLQEKDFYETLAEVPVRRRADTLLCMNNSVSSRERAQELIIRGQVFADGSPVTKPAKLLPVGVKLTVKDQKKNWVSRAGFKLLAGLDAFPSIKVKGSVALDLGASTGGFTDVLLAKGVKKVIAIDVGEGQLHPRLTDDPRVSVLDKTNARNLTKELLGVVPTLIVCDVSFISLKKVLPAALKMAPPDAYLLALIKPQFEVGKGRVGKGGVIRNSQLHEEVTSQIEEWLIHVMKWRHIGTVESPIFGAKGNKEFLISGQKLDFIRS